MEKPIDVLIIESKQNIVKAANESQLPLSILSMIFNEILTDITNKLNVSYPKQHEEYYKSLKTEKPKEKIKE